MTKTKQIAYIVDDEPSMRESLSDQLNASGYKIIALDCAENFLQLHREEATECLFLDVHLPGMSGLELQRILCTCNHDYIPIIFISGYSDVSVGVQAIKNGAIDYLVKPFSKSTLLQAVAYAMEISSLVNSRKAHKKKIAALKQTLSPRETEVFLLVTNGVLNKVIADNLGIAEKTVKVHRGNVMRKMQVSSFAELVKLSLA